MPNAVEALCALFDCEPPALRPLFKDDDKAREKAVKFLKSKSLRTNYKSKGTSRRRDHSVTCTDLTPLGASEMFAYEGILHIRVRQHYFSKHKIWLDHHQLPCIEERHENGHSKYFPLETVSVIEPFANWRSPPKNGARHHRPRGWVSPCSLFEHSESGEDALPLLAHSHGVCEHGARIYPGKSPWTPEADDQPSW